MKGVRHQVSFTQFSLNYLYIDCDIVPRAVRNGVAPSVINPIIIQDDIRLRSRDALLQVIPQPPTIPASSTGPTSSRRLKPVVTIRAHQTSEHPGWSKSPKGRRSRSQSRIKSSEYVNDSSDEVGDEKSPVEAGERGQSRATMDKGKGKQKDVVEDWQERGRKEIGNIEAMDVDSEVDQLAEESLHPSSSSHPGATTKKSSMKAGTETAPTANIGNSEACERCLRKNTACVYGGNLACELCRVRKQKCTRVVAEWRGKWNAKAKNEGKKNVVKSEPLGTPTTPAGEANAAEASSLNPPLRRSSRTRSASRPPEAAKASSTASRGSKPKSRATTPKPTRKPTPTPKSKGKPKAKSRSKSKSGKADEDEDMSDGGETRRGTPQLVTVQELGQVPSQYFYVINREGQQVREGVRVTNGEPTIEGEMAMVQQLQWENNRLTNEMAEMREEMRKLKATMVAMEMSQSVLISNHNAHTALLEQHRIALTTLTSQPPTPSDRRTPSGDGGAMNRLSLPPFRYSTSPSPSNSTSVFPIPPFPTPEPTSHFISPLVTPRSANIFNEIIHPGILEPPNFNMTPSPIRSIRYHQGARVAAVEERAVAGPSNTIRASSEAYDGYNGSRGVALEAATDAMSEEVQSGDAGGFVLIKEEEDEQPKMTMPRIM
jgi:hypothetical protein